MMPILHSPGVMTPGQFGPISGDLVPSRARLTRTMSMHRDAFGDADDQLDPGIDRFQDRVGGEGRRHVDDTGVAPVLARASCTVSNTGRSRCVVPPLPGVTPPTILVP